MLENTRMRPEVRRQSVTRLTIGAIDKSVAIPDDRQRGVLFFALLLVAELRLAADDVVVADARRHPLLRLLDLDDALEAFGRRDHVANLDGQLPAGAVRYDDLLLDVERRAMLHTFDQRGLGALLVKISIIIIIVLTPPNPKFQPPSPKKNPIHLHSRRR